MWTCDSGFWFLWYYSSPLGGGSVKPSTHAGTGQTAKSGKRKRRISCSSETGAEEPGRDSLNTCTNTSVVCLCLKKHTGASWPVIESVIVSLTFWWLRLCFVSGVALPGRAETAEMSDPAQRLAAGSRRWKAREWVAILKDTCPRITQSLSMGSIPTKMYPY